MAGQPKLPVTNMSKGEFAPRLYARADIPEYQAGLKKAQNFIVQKEAGMAFRPGFRFCGEVRDPDGQYRMQPFILSSKLAGVRVFGDFGMEVLAQGGFVVEDDLKIVSMTNAAQAVLEIPYHGFVAGDRLFLTGNTGPTLNERTVTVVAVPDANHVQIDLNTVGMAALTASTGLVRTSDPTPPPPPPDPLPDPDPPEEPPSSGGGGGGWDGMGGGAGGFPPNVN